MKKNIIITISIIIAGLMSVILCSRSTDAISQKECSQVTAIFARGSGEQLQRDEADRFIKQLQVRFQSNALNVYELGNQSYEGYQYPAVDVNPWTHTGTLTGAWISDGYANTYGKSVEEGVKELFYRIVDIHHDCPNSRIVLAGYSQGAQVMSQAIRTLATESEIQDQIDFVALFGDPKLNLPEGRGLFPPACKNEQFSPWRREVPDCNTDNGSLGAQDPYVPSSMENKVGLWCNDNDFVCGSSKIPWINNGHGEYYKDDGPIDHAVLEIAKRVKEKINEASVFTTPDLMQIPSGKPDVMIVIDNTNERTDVFQQFVVPTVNSIATRITQQGGRVGLQTYTGCARKSVKYYLPLSNNPAPLIEQVRTAWQFSPLCDLSQDLVNTIKDVKASANWKDATEKMIIAVPRLPFSTPATTISKSLLSSSTPSFHLYTIAPEEMKESFANMRVDSTKNNPIDLSEADVEIAKNTTNPQVIAELAGPNIKALPGTSITYDASPTEIYDDVVTSYDWDFDGDGNYDLTTTQPKASHIYSSVFAGTMAVKVSTSSGLQDTASRQVTIGDDVFKPNAKAPTQLTATRTSATTAFFQWSATDPRPYHWLISLNDFPMGQVIGSQLFINISELRGEQDNTLTIRAVSKDGDLGDPTSIMLPKNAPIGTSTISSPTESIISLYNSLPPSTKNIFKAVSAGWGFTTGTVKGDSTLKPTESQLAPKKKISTYAIFMIAALLSIVSLMAIVIIKRAYQFNHSRQLKGL